MNIVYLAIAFTLNSVANILLKLSARGGEGEGIVSLARNPFFISGAALFALNIVFYYLALRTLPLSVAYPVMVAMSFIIVNGYALFGFGERITALQLAGYALVIIGIIMVFFLGERG